MGKLYEVSKEELEAMYLEQHLTMQEIGSIFNVTRQAVLKALNKHQVDKSKAERFVVPCDYCKKPVECTRKRWRAWHTRYCNQNCYHAHRAAITPFEGRPWRQGMRIARKVMEAHLGRELKAGEVVHHEDLDNTNNNIDNLILFVSQSEHLRYHHQKRYK